MKYIKYILIALFVCMAIEIVIQDRKIDSLTQERDKYKSNTEILLSETQTFKVRDSLNAARVGTLELSVKEFEKYRAEDAALIKDLQGKNRDLDRLNKAQAQTIITLSDIPRDTIILIDSIPMKAKKVECGDYWYTFRGIMTYNSFAGSLENRDSLVFSESVTYKKFLLVIAMSKIPKIESKSQRTIPDIHGFWSDSDVKDTQN